MEESEDFLSFTSPQSNATPKASRVSTTTLQLLEDDDEVSPTPNPPTPNKPYNTILNTIIPPWITDRSKNSLERKAPPLVRLHNEILQFCQFISPTKEELAARIKAIDEIKRVVLSHWPEAKVHVFGSQLTNILLPSSDIDIAVLDVPIASDETVTDAILSLTDRIRHSIPVSYLEAVVNARVPIIKYDHSESNLSVDICINHDSGLRTGELILKASEQYPPLKPLSLVLKTFLVSNKEQFTRALFSSF